MSKLKVLGIRTAKVRDYWTRRWWYHTVQVVHPVYGERNVELAQDEATCIKDFMLQLVLARKKGTRTESADIFAAFVGRSLSDNESTITFHFSKKEENLLEQYTRTLIETKGEA